MTARLVLHSGVVLNLNEPWPLEFRVAAVGWHLVLEQARSLVFTAPNGEPVTYRATFDLLRGQVVYRRPSLRDG